jgi:hypothetical protein
MLGGIQAGSGVIFQVLGSFLLKALNLPFDNSSAKIEPSFEQRVTFLMSTRQPVAAAMRPMALTSVSHRRQRIL